MRDKCDLYTLIKNNALDNVRAPFDKTVTEDIRKKYKIADVSVQTMQPTRDGGIRVTEHDDSSRSVNSTAWSR